MKKAYLLMMVGCMLLTMVSCSEDAPVTPTQTDDKNDDEPKPELGTLQKLAQTWILEETYENGVQKTSGGTGEYLFTEEGAFFFNANGNWNAIASYEFTGSDSSTIAVTFTGTNVPIDMELKTLTESELKTEFVTNGNTLNYNYTR
jgi:hypothetical protein